MLRIINLLFFVLGLAGIIQSFVLLYDGTRPCSGDGCLIHIDALMGVLLLLITAPVSIITLKREIKTLQSRKK